VGDKRDASQRFLVSAFRCVARQRQSQHEFDWLALCREKLNNLISCHYCNKTFFFMFSAWVFFIYFQFFPLYSLFFTSFYLLIPALYCLLFFSISMIASYFISLLHFTFPLTDTYRMFCNASNDILTLSTVYYSAPNISMGQESKI